MEKLNGKIIYIMCPATVKTGGPELLHQLAHLLNKKGYCAKLVYIHKKRGVPYVAPEFEKYQVPYITYFEIKDDKENLLIIPEIYISESLYFRHIQKVIWWLSVDAFKAYASLKVAYQTLPKKQFLVRIPKWVVNPTKIAQKITYHLCQSQYAIDFVKGLGVEEDRIVYLSDYLNDTYLNDREVSFESRNDVVLYNPCKGAAYTQKLREHAPELAWKPIRNMTTVEVRECMLSSKVYIDFGAHPGKDRIPREAAISGCCVITGLNGSAAYEQDVPIDASYKFEAIDANIPAIIACIRTCLKEYHTEIQKFTTYCEMIKGEKAYFEKCTEEIFG